MTKLQGITDVTNSSYNEHFKELLQILEIKSYEHAKNVVGCEYDDMYQRGMITLLEILDEGKVTDSLEIKKLFRHAVSNDMKSLIRGAQFKCRDWRMQSPAPDESTVEEYLTYTKDHDTESDYYNSTVEQMCVEREALNERLEDVEGTIQDILSDPATCPQQAEILFCLLNPPLDNPEFQEKCTYDLKREPSFMTNKLLSRWLDITPSKCKSLLNKLRKTARHYCDLNGISISI